MTQAVSGDWALDAVASSWALCELGTVCEPLGALLHPSCLLLHELRFQSARAAARHWTPGGRYCLRVRPNWAVLLLVQGELSRLRLQVVLQLAAVLLDVDQPGACP